MAGSKVRTNLLTVEDPDFIKNLRASNARKFSELKKKRSEMSPPVFEGANSPLAIYESTESPKMKREIELRKNYRSPPGGRRGGETVIYKTPQRSSTVYKTPSGQESAFHQVTRGRETVVYKTPRSGGETVIYKTPEAPVRKTGEKSVVPRPKLRPPPPKKKAAPVKAATTRERFNKAFSSAKKSGKRTFVFEGRRFTTKTR